MLRHKTSMFNVLACQQPSSLNPSILLHSQLVCMYICMYVCMYVYMHVYIIYIYIYMYACVCMCTYTQISKYKETLYDRGIL